MINVVLVDDEQVLRKGIRLILEGTDDLSVIGEASNGRDAVQLVLDTQPDVVLMDIRMPVMDGIEATAKLHSSHSDIPVIMLTSFDTDAFIVDALHAGAVGFLLKSTSPEALASAIRSAALGQQMLSPEVLSKLLTISRARKQQNEPQRELEPDSHSSLALLSKRENEIAALIAQGLDNSEISDKLFISVTTVKTHVKNILHKIDGTNRIHIAIAVLDKHNNSLQGQPEG